MAISRAWDSSRPLSTAKAGLGYQEIQYVRDDVSDRMLQDHLWGTGTDESLNTTPGIHSKVTLAVRTDPTSIADAGMLYSKDVSDKAELHYVSESGGTAVIMTSGTSLGSAATPALCSTLAASGVITPTGGIATSDGSNIRTKKISIGDWNMDSTSFVNVAHGLTLSKIRSVDVLIIIDLGTVYYPLNYHLDGVVSGAYNVSETNVTLARTNLGFFDDNTFDSTSFNRGYIYITYEV